jgi:hypothetical protein
VPAAQAEFGTEKEARSMLERAVVVLMKTVTEGKISEVTYWWPRPGTDKPLEKRTFFTKVVDQNCGVGSYKS